MDDKLLLTWENIDKYIHNIIPKIKNLKIDVLIGISRGGLIPLTLISEKLENKNVQFVSVSSYIGEKKSCVKINNHSWKENDLINKNILVIDDVSDTGDTLISLSSFLRNFKPKKVFYYTIFIKPHTKFIPDFYSDKTNKWIIYPWS